MNYSKESLAHESGLELDDFYTDNNELAKADFLLQCINCKCIGTGADFEDMECDGDIVGYCPNCKEHHILIDLSKEA
jgi:hypothetical protein